MPFSEETVGGINLPSAVTLTEKEGKSWTWTYDDAGNIQSKKEYAYTTGTLGTATDTVTYNYDSSWGDLLISYNGTSVTYDGIGNPNSLNGRSYVWEHGRELRQVSYNGTTWTNTYDVNGMRIRRQSADKTYTYVYNGGQLTEMSVDGMDLYFSYDASGRPLSLRYDNDFYYYVTNLQGDVIALLNYLGKTVATYTYDAWGRSLVTTDTTAENFGSLNPLRYRGYVYDTETGLYYLQSRYYDPVFGRFVNADDYISTGNNLLSKNAFAYCYNNPVVYSDDSGTIPWYVIGIIVVAVIGLDHLLAKYQPDGGFSVADEPRNEHARIRGLYAEGHGFEADKNGITICDTEVGLVSCTIAKKNVSFEPVDVFTAFATADLDLSGIPDLDISAVASIYSPYIEFTVPLGDYQLTIEAEAYIGGIGTGVEIDPNSGKFKITPPFSGVGGSFGFDFDFVD